MIRKTYVRREIHKSRDIEGQARQGKLGLLESENVECILLQMNGD